MDRGKVIAGHSARFKVCPLYDQVPSSRFQKRSMFVSRWASDHLVMVWCRLMTRASIPNIFPLMRLYAVANENGQKTLAATCTVEVRRQIAVAHSTEAA
jgi:hypothetical protein